MAIDFSTLILMVNFLGIVFIIAGVLNILKAMGQAFSGGATEKAAEKILSEPRDVVDQPNTIGNTIVNSLNKRKKAEKEAKEKAEKEAKSKAEENESGDILVETKKSEQNLDDASKGLGTAEAISRKEAEETARSEDAIKEVSGIADELREIIKYLESTGSTPEQNQIYLQKFKELNSRAETISQTIRRDLVNQENLKNMDKKMENIYKDIFEGTAPIIRDASNRARKQGGEAADIGATLRRDARTLARKGKDVEGELKDIDKLVDKKHALLKKFIEVNQEFNHLTSQLLSAEREPRLSPTKINEGLSLAYGELTEITNKLMELDERLKKAWTDAARGADELKLMIDGEGGVKDHIKLLEAIEMRIANHTKEEPENNQEGPHKE